MCLVSKDILSVLIVPFSQVGDDVLYGHICPCWDTRSWQPTRIGGLDVAVAVHVLRAEQEDVEVAEVMLAMMIVVEVATVVAAAEVVVVVAFVAAALVTAVGAEAVASVVEVKVVVAVIRVA